MIVYKIVSVHYNEYKSLYANYFQQIALTYKLGEITKSVHGPIFAYSKVWDWSEKYALQNKALMICETDNAHLTLDRLGVSDLDKVLSEHQSFWSEMNDYNVFSKLKPENDLDAKYAYCKWVKPIAVINDIDQFIDNHSLKDNRNESC